MPREMCESCEYPRSTCVCAYVSQIQSNLNIHILQHPKESKSAKNTAKLLNMCLPKLCIHIGESAMSFASIRNILDKFEDEKVCVVYPSEQSEAICNVTYLAAKSKIEHIVFIDATWRKAYKMWQLNPWLQRYRTVNLNSSELNLASKYQIRQTKKLQAYSTLESVVAALKVLEPECETAPLLTLFYQMQQVFLASRRL